MARSLVGMSGDFAADFFVGVTVLYSTLARYHNVYAKRFHVPHVIFHCTTRFANIVDVSDSMDASQSILYRLDI
jgi:hypothetical protein